MNLKSTIKSLGTAYNKSSLWCKILIFISLLLILILVFPNIKKEGFDLKQEPIFTTIFMLIYMIILFTIT